MTSWLWPVVATGSSRYLRLEARLAKLERRLRITWPIVGTYLVVSVLHGAFDSISGIVGYVVVSVIGLIPIVWLWRRADGGGVLPRRSRLPQ